MCVDLSGFIFIQMILKSKLWKLFQDLLQIDPGKMSSFFLLVLLSILVVSVLLIDRGSSSLIEQFITKQGGKILESSWIDLRPNKIRGGPVYKVRFLDRLGNEHKAYLCVNLLGGVRFEEDHIVKLNQSKLDK